MKTIKIFFYTALCSIVALQGVAQTINWESLDKNQRHLANVNIGWDYGLVYGLGYSYQLNTTMPTLLTASFSIPSGEELVDDLKTKIGGQTRLYKANDFQASASLFSIYRRYENPLAQLQNFGLEVNGTLGLYKQKWFIAAEAGFDKAIVTHFTHSESFRENVYRDAKGGWYEPAAGGNFNYGIQAGLSFIRSDITLEIGQVLTQDFKTTPLIPYYLTVGVNYKIGN